VICAPGVRLGETSGLFQWETDQVARTEGTSEETLKKIEVCLSLARG
jgi:hypothetical protein